jgi:hypothetical protein
VAPVTAAKRRGQLPVQARRMHALASSGLEIVHLGGADGGDCAVARALELKDNGSDLQE